MSLPTLKEMEVLIARGEKPDMFIAPDGSLHTRSGKLRDQIVHVINCNSAENGSDTPDFILGQFLLDCLAAFDRATVARDHWNSFETRGKDVSEAPAGPPSIVEHTD